MRFNAVFKKNSRHITIANSPTHVFPGFPTPVIHKLPKQLAAFPQMFAHWWKTNDAFCILANVRKSVGQAGIQTHNPWIDSPRHYRLSYRDSACVNWNNLRISLFRRMEINAAFQQFSVISLSFRGKLPVLLVHLSWHQRVSCSDNPATPRCDLKIYQHTSNLQQTNLKMSINKIIFLE